MTRLGTFLFVFVILTVACTAVSSPGVVSTVTPVQQETIKNSGLPNSAIVDVYDPARDPAEDLKQAISIAQNEKKRIMLELGGDWCIWCKYMDDFYAAHQDLLQFRVDHYVLVKVNVSDENRNEEFLAQFPAPAGYPHIYILDSDGTFLHSQNTVELEDGADSYVLEVFMTFLQKWVLPSK